MAVDVELRIEERKANLELERKLVAHHRALAKLMAEVHQTAGDPAADALQASLWALGVCVVQVVRDR
jgi:hypothetical protein